MGIIDSLWGKVVALDTSPFIYFIEQHPRYLSMVKPFFQAVDRGDISVITSAITLAEVLVVPLRTNDRKMMERYTNILLLAENIVTVEVSTAIATEAAALRATHKFKTPDAIQLATAIHEGADAFFTNDATFFKTLPLEIVFVDNLIGRS